MEIEGLAPKQYGNRRLHCMEIEVFITLCMETDNMEKEGSLSMEIEGTPLAHFESQPDLEDVEKRCSLPFSQQPIPTRGGRKGGEGTKNRRQHFGGGRRDPSPFLTPKRRCRHCREEAFF